MELALPLITAFMTGYLLGAVPFGLIFTWAAGLGDIRAIDTDREVEAGLQAPTQLMTHADYCHPACAAIGHFLPQPRHQALIEITTETPPRPDHEIRTV